MRSKGFRDDSAKQNASYSNARRKRVVLGEYRLCRGEGKEGALGAQSGETKVRQMGERAIVISAPVLI